MNAPQNVSPRRRLQELQAIPERIRTEAEWDELHELEISLAPGNRADGAPPRQNLPGGGGNPRPNPRSAPRSNPRPNPRANEAREPREPREGGEAREGGEVVREGGEAREGRKPFRKRHKKPQAPKTGGGES